MEHSEKYLSIKKDDCTDEIDSLISSIMAPGRLIFTRGAIRSVFSSFSEPVLIFSVDGSFRDMNNAACAFWLDSCADLDDRLADRLVYSGFQTIHAFIFDQLKEIDGVRLMGALRHPGDNRVFIGYIHAFTLIHRPSLDREIVVAIQLLDVSYMSLEDAQQFAREPKPTLSDVELRILVMMVTENFKRAQIAQALGIVPRAFDRHRRNLLVKFKARTVVGLYRKALAWRLVKP